MSKLSSGAELTINPAPFKDAKALFSAVMEEFKGLRLDPNAQVDVNFYKDIACTALSSQKIELCLWRCMERALIDKKKISEDSFENPDKRGDYLEVCVEVAQVNLAPFMKSLYAKYSTILGAIPKSPA